ncbi:MAG TPA: hypothetical protein VJ570_06030 [Holophagaceae bacterium]|nr:hypothetical protein [Holophagaceae bacterium]
MAGQERAIRAYLSRVEQGLYLLGPFRRKRVLRELEGDLRDGLPDPGTGVDVEAWLATRTPPEDLAAELGRAERQAMRIHIFGGLIFCACMAIATSTCMVIRRPLRLSVIFGLAQGLTVGVALVTFRRSWSHLSTARRLALAIATGFAAGLVWGWFILSFWVWVPAFYGAVVGYLSESTAPPIRPLRWILDNLGTSAIALAFAGVDDGWRIITWSQFPTVVRFHAFLQVGLYLGFRLRRAFVLRML